MARNWANLPQELLVLCSQLLCPKDLSAFRAVCHSWRFAAVEGRSDVPWLMLADEEGTRWREFFCLSCQLVHKALLPEAKGKRCFFSGGWMLTMGKEGELHMLKNPMSCCDHIIKLPNLNKFLAIQNSRLLRTYGAYIFKFSLSDSPATSPDYKVVVIYRNCRRLWLWKPGDEEWSSVTSQVLCQ
ncbi:uncharacterized protein LOC104416258 [Eucalyptus grandis]|uniref:uncharacterized protein LOC104416258 n=1 Tax=Eucalyptus grandis TaxID=71139 RepID=UPI0005250682|nr:uncharacterized protein LOC104416258 [Eucalyptus grandis]